MANNANLQADNPNQNCLVDMKCPKCGHFGPFRIHVTTSALTLVSDDGTDEVEGDVEWDSRSACICPECNHTSTVGSFKSDETKKESGFSAVQQLVLKSYNTGDHAIHTPDDTENCGDGLLRFLLTELSPSEDCNDKVTAQYRLDTAIRQLTEVRNAMDDLSSEATYGGQEVADPKVLVILPSSPEVWSAWNISQNLTDRWGEINEYNSLKKPLKPLLDDPALFSRLADQMWEEQTFIVRKDGQYGVLYEIEYTSIESEGGAEDPAMKLEYKPHKVVVEALLSGLGKLAERFPGVQFAVPNKEEIVMNRPAVWAFVPDGALNKLQRQELGIALISI